MKSVRFLIDFVRKEQLLWLPLLVGIAAVIIVAGTFGFVLNVFDNFGFNWQTILTSSCLLVFVSFLIAIETSDVGSHGILAGLAVLFLPILSYAYCGVAIIGSGLLFGYLLQYSAKEATMLQVALTYLGFHLFVGIILVAIKLLIQQIQGFVNPDRKTAEC